MLSGLSPTTKISALKNEVLSALIADVTTDALDAINPVEYDVRGVDDFELCRGIKEKGQYTNKFELLQPSKTIKECGLSGWDIVFLQFRDRDTGELQEITYTFPSLYDEGESVAMPKPNPEAVNKGKRKAGPESDEEIANYYAPPMATTQPRISSPSLASVVVNNSDR